MNEREPSSVPLFLREAWDEVGEQPHAEMEALRACLEPAGQRARRAELTQDLLARVESAPHKYAPFYSRVADLFALEEDTVAELLSDEDWRRAPLPGIEFKEAPRAQRGQDLAATVVRFAPRARFPRHRHTEREQLLILEGGYTDSEGQHYEAGDVHVMDPGTIHGFRVDAEGCLAVSLADRRLVFANPLLRLLAKWVGR